jgi:hypothetical protein
MIDECDGCGCNDMSLTWVSDHPTTHDGDYCDRCNPYLKDKQKREDEIEAAEKRGYLMGQDSVTLTWYSADEAEMDKSETYEQYKQRQNPMVGFSCSKVNVDKSNGSGSALIMTGTCQRGVHMTPPPGYGPVSYHELGDEDDQTKLSDT